MLPTNAPSILTCALRLPPASTTAMSIGCPISSAFRSAASMTCRASSSVMVSFVFAASAIISLSRRFLSMLALEPLRRDLARRTLARSQTHALYPLDLLWYPADASPIPAWACQHNHDSCPLLTLNTQHGKTRRRRYGRGLGLASTAALLLPIRTEGSYNEIDAFHVLPANRKENREPTSGLEPLTPAHYECAVRGCLALHRFAHTA